MNILIFDYNEPILHILNREFIRLGHNSKLIQQRPLSRAAIFGAINETKPDIVLVINFDHATESPEPHALDEVLKEKGIQGVSWFFESPSLSGGSQGLADWYRDSYPRNFHIVCGDSHYIDFFKSRGLGVDFLPMAFDADSVVGPVEPWSHGKPANIFWSGACLSGGLDENLDDIELADYFVYWTLMDIQKIKGQKLTSFFEQRLFEELNQLFLLWPSFDRSFQYARRKWTESFQRLFPDELTKIFWEVASARIDLMYSWNQTTQTLRYINERRPFVAHGSEEWNLMIPGLKVPAERLSREQLYRCYSEQFASLCLTKQTFWDFIHEKIWAIFAQGGFPLADERGDIWRFFKRGDIAVYSHRDEIPELYDFYLKNPEAREKIIVSGRQKVFDSHTYQVRAQELISIFRGLKAGRRLSTHPFQECV